MVGGKLVAKTMTSILENVDKTIIKLLLDSSVIDPVYEKPQHWHLKCLQRLKLGKVPNEFGYQLVSIIYNQINSNWRDGDRQDRKIRSSQNFRFVPQLNSRKQVLTSTRSYTEVSLERRIVEVAERQWPGTWANQVPASSGLLNSVRDTHRNIDLVCRRNDGSVELIELKVITQSGHPLFAALEILQYGVLYMFYRIHNLRQLESPNSIPKFLDAKTIHLRVLAPQSYYCQSKPAEGMLALLDRIITDGLSGFLAEHEDELDHLKMKFQFESFSSGFMQDKISIPESFDEIVAAVLNRQPVCSKHI